MSPSHLIYYISVNTNGEIAQLVERRTHKPKVKGSIPFLATTKISVRWF